MEKRAWGWKLKYMILFLWIFLFSCKAQQADETKDQKTKKEIVATSAQLWQWIQTHLSHKP